MAQRTPRRRTVRRGRASAATEQPNAAGKLMSSLNELLEENKRLVKENGALRATLARIAGLVSPAAAAAPAPAPARRRARAQAAAEPAAAKPRARRRITDPAALERRRESLARARAARAAKLAAGKAAQGE